NKGKEEKAPNASIGTPGFGMWSILATQPAAWKTALKMGHLLNITPHGLLNIHPSAKAWRASRDLPEFRGGAFRKWFRNRKQAS
ncbi:lactate utilization protein LutB domain-containing protein, partial [Arthrospira platensis SPKY1]|nr:lactate utilization protein LutB domain-containing protein [Arthrospira platensis SPKY1]